MSNICCSQEIAAGRLRLEMGLTPGDYRAFPDGRRFESPGGSSGFALEADGRLSGSLALSQKLTDTSVRSAVVSLALTRQ